MSSPADPLLIPLRKSPGPLESVLVHPTGGGLSQYLALAGRLARRGTVHGIRALGLLPGEKPCDDIPEMTEQYLELLRGLPRRPNLLVGWSLGGMLAWELAARLGTEGPAPAVVMVDSFPAREAIGRDVRARVRAAVDEALRTAPGAMDRDRTMRTTHAHVKAVTKHRVTERHSGPTLLVACDGEQRDRQVTSWRRLATDLTVRPLGCGHFEVFQPAHQQVLLRHLDEFLAQLPLHAPYDSPSEESHEHRT